MFNDDDNNDKFLIILAFLLTSLYFLYFNVINVSAHSIDLSEYASEYIDENDESLGVVYYEKDDVEEENIMSSFSLFSTASVNTTSFDEDEYIEDLREFNFLDYPYWVMYLDTVYVSDYPFAFGGDNSDFLYSYDFDNGMNILYESYKLGVSSGLNSVAALRIDMPLHKTLVRSNHNIRYLSGLASDLEAVETYEVPDYTISTYPYMMKFGYYTIISKQPLVLQYDSDKQTIEGLYMSPGEKDTYQRSVRYSYLGTDFKAAPDILHFNNPLIHKFGFEFKEPYPSYNNFLSLVGLLNYDMYYGDVYSRDTEYYDVFFEMMSPPQEWKSFNPEYVYPPEDFGGENGGSEEEEEGNILLRILSYLNPFSDNFFMLVAFVPRETYFADKMQELSNVNNTKLEPLLSVLSSLNVLFNTELDNSSGWNGIGYGDKVLTAGISYHYVRGVGSRPPCKNYEKISGGLIGSSYKCSVFKFDLSDFKLLDASYITAFISRFRYLVGSVMNLFFSLWLIRWALSIFGYYMPQGGYSPGGTETRPIGFR